MAVTFDGETKTIIVDSGTTYLNVQLDLYSAWKEWVLLSDNAKYLPAFTSSGGEPIGPGLTTGMTFIIINGWVIRPSEANHTLTIDGNLFGENGASFVVPTLGSYTVSVQYRNSAIVQGVATVAQIATGVRAELATELGRIDQTISSRAAESSITALSTKVDTVDAAIDITQLTLQEVYDVVAEMIKYHKNRSRIDPITNTLSVYDDDNTTPIVIFDLKNRNGVASVLEIFERVPR